MIQLTFPKSLLRVMEKQNIVTFASINTIQTQLHAYCDPLIAQKYNDNSTANQLSN